MKPEQPTPRRRQPAPERRRFRGAAIAELMAARGMTADELAAACGFRKELMASWRAGWTVPRTTTVELLAHRLGVDVSQFYEGAVGNATRAARSQTSVQTSGRPG